MKNSPTAFRGFRLPRPIDASTLQAAQDASTTQTAVVVKILADAIKRGELPQPKTAEDKRQLKFL